MGEMPGDARSERAGKGEPHHAPLIDADRCVHSLCAVASCEACVVACPRQALALGERALTIDEDACDGCGHCRPACPEAAIELTGVTFTGLFEPGASAALLACERSGVPRGEGTVPCLHGMTARDLDRIAAAGVRTIVTARGECSACSWATPRTLEQAVEKDNAVRRSRGDPSLSVERVSPSAWGARRVAAGARKPDLDQGRRAFLGIFSRSKSDGVVARVRPGPGPGPGPVRDEETARLYRFVPAIDATACIGCDACVHICPHGAVQLAREAGVLHYRLDPSACSGCRLCMDVCEWDAVTIAEMALSSQSSVSLHESRCAKCGAPFHLPALPADGATICRICRKKNHAASLFQVRD